MTGPSLLGALACDAVSILTIQVPILSTLFLSHKHVACGVSLVENENGNTQLFSRASSVEGNPATYTTSMDYLPSKLPSNILLLLTTSLLISHFPIYGHARRAYHIFVDKDFERGCSFDLGDYSFNLCPLAGTVMIASTKYSKDYPIKNEAIREGLSWGARAYQVALGGMSTDSLRLTTSNAVAIHLSFIIKFQL